jgi:hypothetical protein
MNTSVEQNISFPKFNPNIINTPMIGSEDNPNVPRSNNDMEINFSAAPKHKRLPKLYIKGSPRNWYEMNLDFAKIPIKSQLSYLLDDPTDDVVRGNQFSWKSPDLNKKDVTFYGKQIDVSKGVDKVLPNRSYPIPDYLITKEKEYKTYMHPKEFKGPLPIYGFLNAGDSPYFVKNVRGPSVINSYGTNAYEQLYETDGRVVEGFKNMKNGYENYIYVGLIIGILLFIIYKH